MTTIRTAANAKEVRQRAKHTLFVEGSGEEPIDREAIWLLLEGRIRVEPLGASFHVNSAAQALHPYHPDYYFLIDRDHHEDAFIKRYWQNFPDPETHNLLIWPRREFENYFIDPEYALKSSWLKVKNNRKISKTEFRASILKASQKRLYIDVVNLVIVQAREELKNTWIEAFTKPSEFKTKKGALTKLLKAPEFSKKTASVRKVLGTKWIEKEFHRLLHLMTGGKEKLEFGSGKWLEMLRGKKILADIMGSCFQVKDRDNRIIQGPERIQEVIKDLVRKPEEDLPEDFIELKRLIFKRINN